jgi:prolyl-tRNA synthetase
MLDSFYINTYAVSPLALNTDNFSKVVTVLDTSLASSSSTFAIHALAADTTTFLAGSDISTYLHSLESGETKVVEIDFEALKAEAGAPASAAPTKNAQQDKATKEDAKIEGAVQIAVGVKKEVDFPAWYQNVRVYYDCICVFISNTFN